MGCHGRGAAGELLWREAAGEPLRREVAGELLRVDCHGWAEWVFLTIKRFWLLMGRKNARF